MRVFIKYNRSGEVLSVSKVETLPPGVHPPYSDDLGEGEFSMELPEDSPQARLELLELHNGHKVDLKKKKLVKKS